MTLLICTVAGIVTALIWYLKPKSSLHLGFLPIMFFSASLMWLCDAIFEYAELGAEYFNQDFDTMLNDSYLGLSVVVLGLLIWMIYNFIKNPKAIVARITNKE